MKRSKEILIGILWALALANLSCATAGPIAIKCGLQDISIAASDYSEIAADVHSKNWTDLAQVAERIGWATADCVLGDQAAQDPGVKANVDEFRRLHSVELRAAGGSACNDSTNYKANPGDRLPDASPASGGAPRVSLAGPKGFAYLGESVPSAMARCNRACGSRDALGSPGEACQCWRSSKANRRESRWVAAR